MMYLFKNIQDKIIQSIEKSTSSLKIAVTWFTNHEIFNAIIKKMGDTNYEVSLIVLNDRINNKVEGLDFQNFINLNGKFYYSNSENLVHNKFCIVDNSILINGSYNWTYYAENRNWENILLLTDSSIINGYVDEFNRIINSHVLVENISSSKSISASTNSNEYLITDYKYQAKAEMIKGNELTVGRLYNEVLKINKKDNDALNGRQELIRTLNATEFEICPFEIGILFQSGYYMVIPSFVKLPYKAVKTGRTTINNQTSVAITIQRVDYNIYTIASLSLLNIKPSPVGTEKIEHILVLEKNGLLTITCNELNGFGQSVSKQVNIKNFK